VALVSKTGLFAPFIFKNEHFAKTGSGQTSESTLKFDRFSSGSDASGNNLMTFTGE
jgi:hypothetical protein